MPPHHVRTFPKSVFGRSTGGFPHAVRDRPEWCYTMVLRTFLLSCLVFTTCGPHSGSPVSDGTDPAPTSDTVTSQSSSSSVPTSGTSTGEDPTTTLATTSSLADIGSPQECDIWEKDCPSGYKCMPYDTEEDGYWDGTRCVAESRNPDPVGAPCTATPGLADGVDSCAVGAVCWDIDTKGVGTCYAVCGGSLSSPVCPPGFYCETVDVYLFNSCQPSCDPLADECTDDFLCIPVATEWICVAGSGANGPFGSDCLVPNSCQSGLVCLEANSAVECSGDAGCCTPVCDLTNPVCPGVGQECQPWYGVPPPGFEDVGICKTP